MEWHRRRLPIALTDDQVLSIIEGEVLGTRLIEELLTLVDRGDVDESAHLNAERERLTTVMRGSWGPN